MTGSNYPAVNASDVADAPILLPPLPEQRKIAAILSSVDEAIAATEAVIAQTRRVKEGLLQDLLTRGIGRGGRPHTRFKQTEIGEIPESWEIVKLGAIADVSYGLTVNKFRRQSERRYPYLRVADLQNGQLLLEGLVDMGVVEGDVEKYAVRSGDLLLVEGNANIDRLGRPAVYRGDGPPILLHQNHLIRVRVTRRTTPNWVMNFMNSRAGRRQIELEAKTSSGLSTINSGVVKGLRVPIPPRQEQDEVNERLACVAAAIRQQELLLESHRKTKAGLLQDLLTGKVRVSV